MNNIQKLSPKYWIVHDTLTDDVFLKTANKSRSRSIALYETFCIKDGYFGYPQNIKCDLFELKLVNEL